MFLDSLLQTLRKHITQVAQADGAWLVAAIVLIVLVLLFTPPPRKRRIRASVYLLLLHLLFLVLGQLAEPDTAAREFFDLVALFFLLSSLGRSLFILLVQGLFARGASRIPKIFLDIIHALVYIAVFIYILSVAGVEPFSLLTGSALLTVILGLSMRDTLGNVFSGLALQAQRPFDIGDWIQWDPNPSHIGQVVEINWRATKILTLDAVEITVPHSTLGQECIINFTKPKRWSRRSIYFHAPYEAPTQQVQQIILDAIADSPGVLEEPAPSVVTYVFDERGVQYWVRFFTTEFGARDKVDGGVRDRIWYALARAGITMPPPLRQIAIEDASTETAVRREQENLVARIGTLRCVDFFAPLEESDALEQLAVRSRSRRYATGEAIIRQGEPGDELFIIRRGEVVVVLEGPDQPAVEVARMGGGDFFGEMSLLTGEPRTATVRAARPCEVLVVDKAAFGRVLEDFPELAERISQIIARRRDNLRRKQTEAIPDPQEDEEEWGIRLLKRIKDFFSI